MENKIKYILEKSKNKGYKFLALKIVTNTLLLDKSNINKEPEFHYIEFDNINKIQEFENLGFKIMNTNVC